MGRDPPHCIGAGGPIRVSAKSVPAVITPTGILMRPDPATVRMTRMGGPDAPVVLKSARRYIGSVERSWHAVPSRGTHKAGCLRGLAMFISFRLPWLLLLANRAVPVSAVMVRCPAITVRVGSNFVSDTY